MSRVIALYAVGQPHIPNFADPLGLMSHCHRKIENYLAGLAVLGGRLLEGGAVEMGEAFQIIDAAREHFAVRGPKHTADEEVSLFPRLREYGGRDAEQALSALAGIETEHRIAEGLHAEFDELAGSLPRDGSVGRTEIILFNELVRGLTELYRPHIRLEDEIIFPIAARVIPSDVLLLIGEEMRERRRELLTGSSAGKTGGVSLMARR